MDDRAVKPEDYLSEIDRWSLLVHRMRVAKMPLWAMEKLVESFEHGVKKHGAGDYLTHYAARSMEPLNKARRHIEACMWRLPDASEDVEWKTLDDETGIPHMAKAAADLLIGLQVAHGA